MHRALLLVGVVGLASCGRIQESALHSGIDPQPLVVLMGGNTSCRADSSGRADSPYATGLYRRFVGLRDLLKAQRGIDARYITTCYGNTEQIRYATSNAPDTIEATTREQLPALIRRLQSGSEIYILGHSYGGWLAMKTGVELADQPIRGMFTVDPISRVDCNASGGIAGCTRAPRDIGVTEREKIKSASDHWRNFFQTQTVWLHSSPMDEADVNSQIRAAHTSIDSDDGTWNEINAVFLGSIF